MRTPITTFFSLGYLFSTKGPSVADKHHTKRLYSKKNNTFLPQRKNIGILVIRWTPCVKRDKGLVHARARARARLCVCVGVSKQPPSAYGTRTATVVVTTAAACHKGPFPDRMLVVYARARKSECVCIRVYSPIMTTFTALRPIRERSTRTFCSLFRRCVQHKSLLVQPRLVWVINTTRNAIFYSFYKLTISR